MNHKKLNLLPPLKEIVERTISIQTINYEFSTSVDEFGDREVVDVTREFNVKVNVPKISFMDWIDTLCMLKKNGILTTHLYSNEFEPYIPNNNSVWQYFDQVNENLLTNGYQNSEAYKVRIYVYWIKEFKYYAVLRLLSHHDIVSYSS